MIDWITATVPYVHEHLINGGAVMKVDSDGTLTWQREMYQQIEGSFSSSAVIVTHWPSDYYHRLCAREGIQRWVRISGNPSKFVQGHNLFGSENLPALAPLFFRAVCLAAGLTVDDVTWQRWLGGDFRLDRVDVAYMLDVGDRFAVRDTLCALAHQATVTNRGRGTHQTGTVSWGRRSSRLSVIKCYDKEAEITGPKKHQLPENIPHREDLLAYAVGKVRVEVEFHSHLLEQAGLRDGANWHADTASLRWSQAMQALHIAGQVPLTPQRLQQLPPNLRGTYALWESGRDVRAHLTKPTYYRHRKQLLAVGIDISQPYRDDYEPRVVSLQKVLQPVPSPAPRWAHGTPLLAAA